MTISEANCLEILHKLYLIRTMEETIAARYAEGQMRCPVHLSVGQEGVPAALAPLLRRDDLAVSTHRGHAHYMGKGGSIKAMLAEILGRQGGCSAGKGGSMHLIDESVGFKGTTAIVANTIPVGVGLGLAIHFQNRKNVAVVFLGDGAVEEGAFYESVNFAIVSQLPVLFVCENNFYSVYSSLKPRQPEGRVIHKMVAAMGIKSITGDGNDVAAIHTQLDEALIGLRAGSGPVFAEFTTYRWREHCGPNYDNDLGYRTMQEFEEWKKQDPIARFENYLLKHCAWAQARLDSVKNQVESEVQSAFDWVMQQPYPDAADAFTDVYQERLP